MTLGPAEPIPGRTPRVMEGWVSVRDVLADAERRLAAAGVPSPGADAAILLSHVTGLARGRLLLQDPLDPAYRTAFERLLTRRMSRVPVQHLVGSAPFRAWDIPVGPGVFIPRPETEVVAGAAIDALRAAAATEGIAVDLCAGSAAIAVSIGLEVPGSEVWAVEVDPDARAWAERTLAAHADALAEAGSTVHLVAGDAGACAEDALAELRGRVQVVVANPPYIPEDAVPQDPEVREHDPRLALYGGPDGLDVVRALAGTAAALLRPGGTLVVEHADVQGEGEGGVPDILRTGPTAAAWTDVADHRDLARRPRYTTAVRTAVEVP